MDAFNQANGWNIAERVAVGVLVPERAPDIDRLHPPRDCLVDRQAGVLLRNSGERDRLA